MKRLTPLSIFLIHLFFSGYNYADEAIWILIDTHRLQLEVKKGNKTLTVMENIAIGRSGAGFKHRVGDDVTPIGSYKIAWVNKKSPFHLFYGFNYPSTKNADQALSAGLLDKKAHSAIIDAHNSNKTPPQHTKIGGRIGIHGLGNADESIHKTMNWTHGCVALTNEQIDRLEPWITENMRVKIK
jgi:murein L,D-transpeptidase YafK